MEAITLKFKDDEGKVIKEFSATGIKTGLIDKLFDIRVQQEKMAHKGASYTDVKPVYDNMKCVLVEIYKNQFTVNELNECVLHDEMTQCFKEWMEYILKN